MSLKLVTVNIEGDKHFDTVFPFLQEQQPDVVCLQEVFEADLELFTKTLGGSFYFVPHTNLTDSQQTTLNPKGLWGVAVWMRSGLSHDEPTHYYYRGNAAAAYECKHPGYDASRAVIVVKIQDGLQELIVATTHFTWTPDGVADDRQREDIRKLMTDLEKYPELVLCGDFNAPRGQEIYNTICQRFTDHLPENIASTLDPKLHYIGDSVKVVVDTIFATPGYAVRQVTVHEGVSDHKAISATISRL